jgi:hypothetical protein
MNSNVISLNAAVDELGQICRSKAAASSLFLMVGAGVSSPVIATVSDIIDDCKRVIRDGTTAAEVIENAPVDPKQTYSWYIETAFPSVADRWRYFASLI